MAAKSTKKVPAKKKPATKAVSKNAAVKMPFDSAVLVKKLLSEVPERAREVLTYRFGLGASSERETLEAIGERWSITRERVRQIEAAGLEAIRGSKSFRNASAAFNELCDYVHTLGVVVEEEELLSGLASD